MGAYYKAVLEDIVSIDPHKHNNGMKLMEHSYLRNSYVNQVLMLLLNNPKRLQWLCDYHEATLEKPITWDMVLTDEQESTKDYFSKGNLYVINKSKMQYFSYKKIEELSNSEWVIHPIPILCNSEVTSMGGGDYHQEDSRRGTWFNDVIMVTNRKPSRDFKDVSEDLIFTEEN